MISYSEIISFLVNSADVLGYTGTFLLMFLESSFFPFPSEVVMIPAGYLASQGKVNLILVIIIGTLGSISGAWFNYILARKLGRRFVLKILKEKFLRKIEAFFYEHGPVSTFNGRLIPLVRQYISFPAGLAKMNPLKFTLYTGLGAGIWVSVLALLGYFLGENKFLIQKYLKEVTIFLLIMVAVLTILYYKNYSKNKRN